MGGPLTVATGQNTNLDPAMVSACYPVAEELHNMLGEYGVFGEDLRGDRNASEQTKLPAIMGPKA